MHTKQKKEIVDNCDSAVSSAMARLLGCIEVKLQLALFKNIDLRREGLYRVRVGVEAGSKIRPGSQDSKRRDQQRSSSREGQLGTPFQLNFHAFPLESTVNERKVEDSLCLHLPAIIGADEHSFHSSTFLVRYIDETFLSGDEVSFRFYVDALDPPSSVNLTVALEMATVKECVERSGLEDIMAGAKVWKLDPEPVDKESSPVFTDLIRKDLTLHNYAKGMNEYVPILFDDCISTGFGLLEVLVHSACVDVLLKSDVDDQDLDLDQFLWQVYRKGRKSLSLTEPETDTHPSIKILSDRTLEEAVSFLENIRKLVLGPGVCTYNCLKAFQPFVDDTLGNPLQHCVEENSSPVCPNLEIPSLLYDRQHGKFARVGEEKEGKSFSLPTFGTFCKLMFLEAKTVYNRVQQLWNRVLRRIAGYTLMLKGGMKSRWKERAKDRAGESIVRYLCSAEEVLYLDQTQVLKHHAATAKALRQAEKFSHWEKLPLEDLGMFVDKSCYPIIFEQHYVPFSRQLDTVESRSAENYTNAPNHAVILVHGFMGSSWDLRSFRNYLSLLESGCVFLLSRVNEDNTDSSIGVLAENLAAEMKQFLDTSSCKFEINKVSVIGHSLGSVIARAALRHPALNKYRGKLHCFFSLASPHLGTMGSSSYVVSTGMWLLSKWRKSKSLEELALLDGGDLRKSLLYELALGDILHQFSNVVLVSGHQDQYVPYHSARIQIPHEIRDNNSVKAQVQREMAESILEHIRPSTLTRMDFSFYFDRSVKNGSGASDSRLDTLIGRAAHVKVLDSPVLIMTLLLHYHDRFFSDDSCSLTK